MNLKIDLDKNVCLTQNLVSLIVKIIGKDINIYKNIVDSSNININIDKLENNKEYKILVSVVMDGKQILKKFKEFTYENYDEYIIDENMKISNKINKKIIKKVNLINDGNKNNIEISINPLVAYRIENNGKMSLYNNGGILLLKNELSNIVQKIINNKYIICSKDIENINILLLKGCLVAYEK